MLKSISSPSSLSPFRHPPERGDQGITDPQKKDLFEEIIYSWIPASTRMTEVGWMAAIVFLLLCLTFPLSSHSEKLDKVAKIPQIQKKSSPNPEKYVYIKSNKVNLRAGPDFQYPIKWIITSRGEPMKVLGTFYQWIHLEDINGNKGWLQTPMVSTRRTYGIVINPTKQPIIAYATDSALSRKIAKLEPGVRLQVLKCKASQWCKISANNLKAWIPQKNLWGVNAKD
jgi:SH3-like domain-containing protein